MNDDEDQKVIDAYGEKKLGGSSISPEEVTEDTTEEKADKVGWLQNIRKGEESVGTGTAGGSGEN